MAASDLSTKFNSTNMMAKDGFYTFSNLGSCVDIFAPGAIWIGPPLLGSLIVWSSIAKLKSQKANL